MKTAMHLETYQPIIDKYKATLASLCDQAFIQQRPVIIVMDGWTATGKEKIIECLIGGLDPDRTAWHKMEAPQGDETAHHFLWRYWLRLPPAGQVATFTGSWYRRVLHDRVEGICTGNKLKRAFREINQFERQNTDFGTILIKFWMQINHTEQSARYQAQRDDHPGGDTGDEEVWYDLLNRRSYEQAANEMLLKTSTPEATWTIVPADSENYACLHVLQTAAYNLSRELNFYPSLSEPSLSDG